MLALDARDPSLETTEITAQLAARHDCEVAIVAGPPQDAVTLSQHAAIVHERTGREPLVLEDHGAPHKAIVQAAVELGASLVVTGSRGVSGVRAIRSVSERVAHAAPCSVLVVRPRVGRD